MAGRTRAKEKLGGFSGNGGGSFKGLKQEASSTMTSRKLVLVHSDDSDEDLGSSQLTTVFSYKKLVDKKRIRKTPPVDDNEDTESDKEDGDNRIVYMRRMRGSFSEKSPVLKIGKGGIGEDCASYRRNRIVSVESGRKNKRLRLLHATSEAKGSDLSLSRSRHSKEKEDPTRVIGSKSNANGPSNLKAKDVNGDRKRRREQENGDFEFRDEGDATSGRNLNKSEVLKRKESKEARRERRGSHCKIDDFSSTKPKAIQKITENTPHKKISPFLRERLALRGNSGILCETNDVPSPKEEENSSENSKTDSDSQSESDTRKSCIGSPIGAFGSRFNRRAAAVLADTRTKASTAEVTKHMVHLSNPKEGQEEKKRVKGTDSARAGSTNSPFYENLSSRKARLVPISMGILTGKPSSSPKRSPPMKKKLKSSEKIVKIEEEEFSEGHESPPHSADEVQVKPNLSRSGSGDRNLTIKGNSREEFGKLGKRELKNIVREKVKKMILSAGWRIELRPRLNKDYEDSVYVSPSNAVYWSIPNAYYGLQRELGCAVNKDEILSRISSESGPNRSVIDVMNSAFSPEELPLLFRKTTKEKLKRIKEGKKSTAKMKNGQKAPKSKGGKKVKKGVKINLKKRKQTKDKSAAKSEGDNQKPSSALDYDHDNSNHSTEVSHGKKKKGQRVCRLVARMDGKGKNLGSDCLPYTGKRTILSWLIDSGVIPADIKLQYWNKKQTKVMLEGVITRDGILCNCCSKVLTVSKFEIHAGSKLGQPYENILLDNGMSLLECQLKAWNEQGESKRLRMHVVEVDELDQNDDTCGICGDGGNLICCDSCPSTFHLSCLGLQTLPTGIWHCPHCSCKFCGEAQESTGNITASLSSMLVCYQCEEKYHHECQNEHDVGSAKPCSEQHSFCCINCEKIHKHLNDLLGVKNDLENGYSWSIVKRFDEEVFSSHLRLEQRIECNSKLAVALSVMDECFMPIIDQRSSIELISSIVYNCGSNFNRLNYSGLYTVVLEKGDEIISVASIRIHGTKLAEMPLIGTRHIYRRQGMCRRLVDVVECILRSINVERLVIPAITDLLNTWTSGFGFESLEESHREEMRKMNMMVFPGTDLLQKSPLGYKHVTGNSGGDYLVMDTVTRSQEADVDVPHQDMAQTGKLHDEAPSPDHDITILSKGSLISASNDVEKPSKTLPGSPEANLSTISDYNVSPRESLEICIERNLELSDPPIVSENIIRESCGIEGQDAATESNEPPVCDESKSLCPPRTESLPDSLVETPRLVSDEEIFMRQGVHHCEVVLDFKNLSTCSNCITQAENGSVAGHKSDTGINNSLPVVLDCDVVRDSAVFTSSCAANKTIPADALQMVDESNSKLDRHACHASSNDSLAGSLKEKDCNSNGSHRVTVCIEPALHDSTDGMVNGPCSYEAATLESCNSKQVSLGDSCASLEANDINPSDPHKDVLNDQSVSCETSIEKVNDLKSLEVTNIEEANRPLYN